MNPTIITARVTDQHLQLVNETLIASGGVDVLQIRFEFCGLWTGCGKTAVFYRNPEEVYHVPVVDNLVTVPWEVLANEGHFYFGVFGVKSNLRPTEVVKVRVARGAITEATATPEEPTPDIYEQLLAAYGEISYTHEQLLTGGYVEALKEKNEGGKFSFWVGTTAEYNAIPEKVRNCFYILTDDMSRNEIIAQLGKLEEDVTNLKSQTVTDKYYGNITAPLRLELKPLKAYMVVVSQLGVGAIVTTGAYIAVVCDSLKNYPTAASKLVKVSEQSVFTVSLVDTPNSGTELVIENPSNAFLQLSVTEI